MRLEEGQRLRFVAMVDLGGVADAHRDRQQLDLFALEELPRQVAGGIDDESDTHGRAPPAVLAPPILARVLPAVTFCA